MADMTRRTPAKPAAVAATPPLEVADLVADCAAQRDALLRDVYALTADQLEHLAYCTRVLLVDRLAASIESHPSS